MTAEIIILKPGPKNWRERLWRKLHARKDRPRGASRPGPRKPTPPSAA